MTGAQRGLEATRMKSSFDVPVPHNCHPRRGYQPGAATLPRDAVSRPAVLGVVKFDDGDGEVYDRVVAS